VYLEGSLARKVRELFNPVGEMKSLLWDSELGYDLRTADGVVGGRLWCLALGLNLSFIVAVVLPVSVVDDLVISYIYVYLIIEIIVIPALQHVVEVYFDELHFCVDGQVLKEPDLESGCTCIAACCSRWWLGNRWRWFRHQASSGGCLRMTAWCICCK
jgi:hypothetical protein